MTTYADESDELTGGRWVTVRGVKRWIPEPDVTPEPTPIDITRLLACPTCHAKTGAACKTKTGHRTTPHYSRLVPRLCRCGEVLASRSRYCPPCRDAVNRENKRDYLRRMRAERKAADMSDAYEQERAS